MKQNGHYHVTEGERGGGNKVAIVRGREILETLENWRVQDLENE